MSLLPSPSLLFLAFWVAWAVSWIVAARWAAPATARATGPAASSYRLLLVLGGVLLAWPTGRGLPALPLWSVGYHGAQLLALLSLPGFAFAWWARIHLGTLWSSAVTRKEGHRIIDTGPYAIVRHPIYTGLLEACLVSAMARGTVPALVGLGAILLGVWIKARLEERFLAEELGPAYEAYRARVPMLLPFWPA